MKSELATPSSGLLRYACCSSVGTAEQALPSRQCQLCRLLTCIYLQRSLARRKCARCGERRQRKGVVRYPDDSLKFAGLGRDFVRCDAPNDRPSSCRKRQFEFNSLRHPNLGLSILDDVREMPEVAGHREEVSPGSSSMCYGAIARYPDPRKLRRWSATDSAHHIAHFY